MSECGANGRGLVARSCVSGRWVAERCEDPDECLDGAAEERMCGLNRRARQRWVCQLGQWVAREACDDPDACVDREEARRICDGGGFNGRAEESRRCERGQWGPWSACEDPDECRSESLEHAPCGLNERAEVARRCSDGQWGAWSPCADPDECVDASVESRACGAPGSRAIEARGCVEGRWAEWGACALPACGAGDAAPPCNGCPAGTVVPDGWVCVPAGEFWMGSPEDEPDRYAQQEALHEVRISRPYFVKITEVTQGEWESVMGDNPSHFGPEGPGPNCGLTCPVERVSWLDALDYVNALSDRAGLPRCYDVDRTFVGPACLGYRLPTEAEWERAYRAGSQTAFYWGDVMDEAYAWFGEGPDGRTRPVARKRPNAWGLYDMAGNVYEWTWDRFARDYGGLGDLGAPLVDPLGPAGGDQRVIRGGSFSAPPHWHRAAMRSGFAEPNRPYCLGLRPVRTLP